MQQHSLDRFSSESTQGFLNEVDIENADSNDLNRNGC